MTPINNQPDVHQESCIISQPGFSSLYPIIGACIQKKGTGS